MLILARNLASTRALVQVMTTLIKTTDPQGGMDCLQLALGSQPHWDVFFVDAQADFKLGVVEMVEIVEIVNANVKQDHI